MGVSVFTDPLLAATGLDRLAFSNAYLLGTLGSALLLPRAGVILDRLGVRLTAMLTAFALGVVLTLLSQVDRLALAAAGLASIETKGAAFVGLSLLFVGLRFSGQGVMTLASRTMLARWFSRRRGTVTAISATVAAFGFAYAPRVLDAWIERSGWRGAWLELAALELVGMGLIAFLWFRESPESCGLRVDGVVPSSEPGGSVPAEATATRGEALRSRSFWLLTLGLALQGMIVTGISLHVVDLGAEAGLDRSAALSLFVPMAVSSTAAAALLGWLADRVRIRTLLLGLLASEVVGVAASAHLGHPGGVLARGDRPRTGRRLLRRAFGRGSPPLLRAAPSRLHRGGEHGLRGLRQRAGAERSGPESGGSGVLRPRPLPRRRAASRGGARRLESPAGRSAADLTVILN
jgi:hypothetical protein